MLGGKKQLTLICQESQKDTAALQELVSYTAERDSTVHSIRKCRDELVSMDIMEFISV